jgi:hypothetical protein
VAAKSTGFVPSPSGVFYYSVIGWRIGWDGIVLEFSVLSWLIFAKGASKKKLSFTADAMIIG